MIEIWRSVNGYDEHYEVSNTGKVRSNNYKRTGMTKELSNRVSKHTGYCTVNLMSKSTTKTVNVHRLVAVSFIDNPEGKPTVNHKNGIKTDNRVENLEWTTHRENQLHALFNGLKPITYSRIKTPLNSEMKQETRGRKPNKTKGKEVKVSRGVYSYPAEFKRIEKRFGTIGKFWEHCLLTNQILTTKN